MPVIVAGVTGIDINNPEVGALAFADPVAANPTYYSLRDGGFLDEFFGSFQYNVFGEPAGGTITRWRQTFNGALVFDISGASVSVSQFLGWVASDDNFAAVTTILAGADTITGSVFTDNLPGYGGDDSISGGGDADTIDGGAGLDTVSGGLGNDVIRDLSGANYLRGNEGDDNIVGGSNFDDAHGNMGNDTVAGGLGDDWVVGGQDHDLLNGGDGFDLVYGNLGADTVNGDAGPDWVRGGQQNDLLNGGAGDDFMSGDRDADTMTGGTGADLFNLFAGSGADRITDFSLAGGDRIRWEGGLPSYTVTQVGADTVIAYGAGGDQVTLVGVQASTLIGTGWFIVV